jgi:hypothetical protein
MNKLVSVHPIGRNEFLPTEMQLLDRLQFFLIGLQKEDLQGFY